MSKKFGIKDGDANLAAAMARECQGPIEDFINEASAGLFNRPDRMGGVIAHALVFLAWQYASAGKSAVGGVPIPKRFGKFAKNIAENETPQDRGPWARNAKWVKK